MNQALLIPGWWRDLIFLLIVGLVDIGCLSLIELIVFKGLSSISGNLKDVIYPSLAFFSGW